MNQTEDRISGLEDKYQDLDQIIKEYGVGGHRKGSMQEVWDTMKKKNQTFKL